MTLKDTMANALEAGWADAVPLSWRQEFDNVSPDFTAHALNKVQEGEFSSPYPSLLPDQNQRHLFRAFRGIAPNQVRVCVIGQDPYPERDRATGRAFEDGAAHSGIAISLRRLLQSAVTVSNQNQKADENASGWSLIRDDADQYFSETEAMTMYFDRLAEEGVLFLNAAWTFTESAPLPSKKELKYRRDRIQRAHAALWKPVTLRLIKRLAERDDPPVFLLLGKKAKKILSTATKRDKKEIPNVYCPHPTARKGAYFNHRNPLAQVNEILKPAAAVKWSPFDDEINEHA
ncbi:uracil-DNA glycosylase family protein [Paenirhodobacter populi]|uniref:Uracil-DNA glycosylase n=1 Tax=Paenirhodobacter populi TaxID=2306993 RepID=A0A443J8W7_9RHOB|nr:uracil-DNA glycosylase family protein [Sinirhodobacter populi]RWR16951.1 hypothetical protein D2T30_20395 [Sinirhodobacter populi]